MEEEEELIEEEKELDPVEVQRARAQNKSLNEFFGKVDEIKGWLGKIEENLEILKEKRSNFGEIQDLSEETFKSNKDRLRKEVSDLREETNGLGQSVKTELKKMKLDNVRFLEENSSETSVCTIRTNMYGVLVRNCFDLLQEFHHAGTQFDDRMRNEVFRQVKGIVGAEVDDERINEILDMVDISTVEGNQKLEQVLQSNLRSGQKMDREHAEQVLDLLQEKHNDLLELERAIAELSQLMMDLSLLVQDQADRIDQIQYSVLQTKAYHDKSARLMGATAKTATKIRRKKVCVNILCCCIPWCLS